MSDLRVLELHLALQKISDLYTAIPQTLYTVRRNGKIKQTIETIIENVNIFLARQQGRPNLEEKTNIQEDLLLMISGLDNEQIEALLATNLADLEQQERKIIEDINKKEGRFLYEYFCENLVAVINKAGF